MMGSSSDTVLFWTDALAGSWELVTLYRGAVGVRIQNNYFHNYIFTAIRCGADVGYVMDCHQTWIGNNYIYAKPFRTLTGDSAGIYFCTHWFNPGMVPYPCAVRTVLYSALASWS